jgi:HK97 family phage prohead protease
MEEKSFTCYTKEVDGRTVTGLAAVFGNVDSQGDRIHRGAFKKTIRENARHFRHLWQHDYRQPPIAKIESIEEVTKTGLPSEVLSEFPDATGGLQVKRTYLETPRGSEVLQGILSGALNEMSFMFDVVKSDFDEESEKTLIRNLRELRLWDTSDVNWGANPATVASKAAVPYRDTGMDVEGEWRAPTLADFTDDVWADLTDAEKTRIANHFAWAEQLPPENYGQLKLPHHRPGRSGVGPAVWRGVAAAMAALLGARGGVQIPDADRRGVYNHLARHYEQFEKEPPNFKLVSLVCDIITISEEELDAWIATPSLKSTMLSLQSMLRAAEPWEVTTSNSTLTAAVLSKLKLLQIETETLTLRS